MARDFAGRLVVVTGAAGGLGAALCDRFTRAGASVAALDVDEAGLDTLCRRLGEREGRVLPVRCDVTSEADCLQAFARIRAELGGVDVLVNNAGITHRSPFARTAPRVLRQVIEVNYLGAVHCTHAALGDLLERRGMLVAISSVAGYLPLLARSGYAASKHAVNGFFETLRLELAPSGVHVLLVCPAFVRTDIDARALGPDGGPVRHPKALIGRPSSPDTIAARILRAAQLERQVLLPDAVSWMSWWLGRLAPRLVHRIMARRLQREMD